jgi:hypothetical protein
MSRSYKKQPIIKDKRDTGYNKVFRRTQRMIEPDDDTIYPLSRELTNDYDICDWKWLANSKEEKLKYRRK